MFSFFCFIFYFILLLSYILFFYFLVPQAAKEAKVPPRCSRPNRTPPPPPNKLQVTTANRFTKHTGLGSFVRSLGLFPIAIYSANVDRRVRADVRRPRTRLHGNHSSTSNYHKLVFVSLFCATAYCFYIEQRMGLGRFVWSHDGCFRSCRRRSTGADIRSRTKLHGNHSTSRSKFDENCLRFIVSCVFPVECPTRMSDKKYITQRTAQGNETLALDGSSSSQQCWSTTLSNTARRKTWHSNLEYTTELKS